MARKKVVKKGVAKIAPIAPIARSEPQISKDPSEPWHEVTERYGNKLKPKYQLV